MQKLRGFGERGHLDIHYEQSLLSAFVKQEVGIIHELNKLMWKVC
jgi:hypothetical protein